MKTLKYKSGAIIMIQLITVLLGLQINLFSTEILSKSYPENKLLLCVTCKNSDSANQNGVLSEYMIWLAPTTPSEAPFSDEIADTELNIAQTSPEETSFEGDPELINSSVMEFLKPAIPIEADFKD
jgi:hypothetical protein